MDILANATLLEIRAAGDLDEYGKPDADGAVLWSGTARGYLKRARRQRELGAASGDQRADRGLTDTFTILGTALAGALEQAGPAWEATTVLIEDQRSGTAVTRRFTVQGMENRAVGSIADSVKLELTSDGTGT